MDGKGKINNIHRRWLKALLLFVFVYTAIMDLQTPAAETGRRGVIHEYQIKAAFICNFIKFTEWPEEVFKDQRTPIRIAIVGPDKFGRAFAPFQAKTVKGRGIEIIHHHTQDPMKDIHVAFFTRENHSHNECRLLKKPYLPVLTIGEKAGFIRQGGMMNFVIVNKKIRFEVNRKISEAAGLKISSKLLQLATSAQEEEE